MSSITTFKSDKLIGRSNYIEQKVNADLYLEITGFIPYIDSNKLKFNKLLYYKLIKFNNKNKETTYRFYS